MPQVAVARADARSDTCCLQKHEPFNVIGFVKTPYGLMICAPWSVICAL